MFIFLTQYREYVLSEERTAASSSSLYPSTLSITTLLLLEQTSDMEPTNCDQLVRGGERPLRWYNPSNPLVIACHLRAWMHLHTWNVKFLSQMLHRCHSSGHSQSHRLCWLLQHVAFTPTSPSSSEAFTAQSELTDNC